MVNLTSVIEDTLLRWKAHGNKVVSNGSLQYNWNTIGEIYNTKLQGHSDTIQVIPAQTGTGKTLFTKVYLAHLLAYTDKPALMVVRERVTAHQVKNDIIKFANKLCSTHSGSIEACFSDGAKDENGNSIKGLPLWHPQAKKAQILIVTHNQISRAAEDAWREQDEQYSRLDLLYQTISGERNLVIIDEEIQLANTHSLSVEKLKNLKRRLDDLKDSSAYSSKYSKLTTCPEFKAELAKIGEVKKALNKFETSSKKQENWIALRTEFKRTKTICNTKALAEYLNDVYWDRILLLGRGNNVQLKREINELVQSTLAACDVFTRTWSFWDEKESQAKMCNLMIATGLSKGAVILDATSTVNSSYELLKEESGIVDCEIVPVKQVKNYSQGTLRVSYTKYAGKGMEDTFFNEGVPSAADLTNRATSIVNNIQKTFEKQDCSARKILIVTHKDYERSVLKKIANAGLNERFAAISVSHWGVLDGKNSWSDYDDIFVTSLPFLPDTHLVDMLMTLIGPDAAQYTPEKISQVKKELWITQAISSVIQAVNRIGFRNIVDAEGNTKACNAYVVLPRSENGQEAYELLVNSLEGINVESWDYGYKTTTTKSRNELTPSDMILNHLRDEASIKPTSLAKLATQAGVTWSGPVAKQIKHYLFNENSNFCRSIRDLGVTIDVNKTASKTYIKLSK